MRTSAALDRLVAGGSLSGYTVEADTSYLYTRRPTLTYRMYAGHSTSERNLDEFRSAMSRMRAELRSSRLVGVVAGPGGLVRTDQVCVRAVFDDDRTLGQAVALVLDRFASGPVAIPGSWRFPDVRIRGGAHPGTIPVWAHRWGAAVALALSPIRLAPHATRVRVRVLACWTDLLTPIDRLVSEAPGGLLATGGTDWRCSNGERRAAGVRVPCPDREVSRPDP